MRAGAASLGATSSGHVNLRIVSDEVGTIGNSADDTTLVAVGSVPITAQGLSLAALSDTDYVVRPCRHEHGAVQQHVRGNRRVHNRRCDHRGIGRRIADGRGRFNADGARDFIELPGHPVAGVDLCAVAVVRGDCGRQGGRRQDSRLHDHIGRCGPRAGGEKHAGAGSASAESVDYTSIVPATAYSISMAGTYVVNQILGSVLATIDTSTVSTTSGDVAVQAADTSVIDAEATAGATALGGASSLAVGGAIALNAIGVKAGSDLATATVDALLGSSFFSDATRPAKVSATIVNSVVTPAGALVLTALGNSLINATVTNIASATGTALLGNSARSAGVILSTNKVNRSTTASIDNSTTPSKAITGGTGVSLDAEDNASIQSNSKIVASFGGNIERRGQVRAAGTGLHSAALNDRRLGRIRAGVRRDRSAEGQLQHQPRPVPAQQLAGQRRADHAGDIVEMSKGFAKGDFGALYRYIGPNDAAINYRRSISSTST